MEAFYQNIIYPYPIKTEMNILNSYAFTRIKKKEKEKKKEEGEHARRVNDDLSCPP